MKIGSVMNAKTNQTTEVLTMFTSWIKGGITQHLVWESGWRPWRHEMWPVMSRPWQLLSRAVSQVEQSHTALKSVRVGAGDGWQHQRSSNAQWHCAVWLKCPASHLLEALQPVTPCSPHCRVASGFLLQSQSHFNFLQQSHVGENMRWLFPKAFHTQRGAMPMTVNNQTQHFWVDRNISTVNNSCAALCCNM